MQRVLFALCILILINSCKSKDAHPLITSDGVNIAYDKCGKGDTTLLFVHGWCINKEYWADQLKTFCPRYTVVAIDLPGFGASGKNRKDWTFDAYANDIKNVIDQLKLKNVVLIGHSMSGNIVLQADNKYPQLLAGIVGIDNLQEPGSPSTPEAEKEYADFFKALTSNFDTVVTTQMAPSLFQKTTPKSVYNRVMNDVYASDSLIAIAVLQGLVRASGNERALMRGLSHKLYLVNSDALEVKKDTLSAYCRKGFNVELVRHCSHYPMIEKAILFNLALQRSLNEMSK